METGYERRDAVGTCMDVRLRVCCGIVPSDKYDREEFEKPLTDAGGEQLSAVR